MSRNKAAIEAPVQIGSVSSRRGKTVGVIANRGGVSGTIEPFGYLQEGRMNREEDARCPGKGNEEKSVSTPSKVVKDHKIKDIRKG